jgi:hypothetical protein
MTNNRLPLLFFLLLFIFSCSKTEKNEDLEKNIFYDLIPELVDRSCLALPPPPPPLDQFDKTNYIEKEKKYLKLVDSLNKSSKTIALNDTIFNISDSELIDLKPKLNFNYSNTDNYNQKIVLNLNSVKFKPNIKLLKNKEIIKVYKQLQDGKSWDEIPTLKGLQCTISFSRIILNTEKNKGFFTFGVGCGRHCGSGFNVWIKKINGKWIIEKQESTWVA